MVDVTKKVGRRRRRSGDFSLKPHVYQKKWKEQTTNKNDFHDDLVATQILSRLPAKSLMRFKSACKGWKAIIEKDSHFINLHRTRSQARPPRLMTVVHNIKDNDETRGFFDLLSADLDCDSGDGDSDVKAASIRSVMSVRAPNPTIDVMGPVRGLACFADLGNFEVLIYNVSTRQAVTSWIRSTVSQKYSYSDEPVCQFGYDSDTGEHKVIFVWHDPSGPAKTLRPVACEVLTVGVDTSWRIIDDTPPTREFIGYIATYANGSIYWMLSDKGSEYLLAFDIGSEKFRTIIIPEFTLLGCRSLPYCNLIELDGCLTLVRICRERTQRLWKLCDRNKNGTSNSTTVSRSEREDWSEVRIEVPCNVTPSDTAFHPLPGKDLIILETYDQRDSDDFQRNVELASFYCYNRINKTVSKFEIQGIPSLPDKSRTYCKVLVEDDLFSAAEKKPVKNPS